MIVINESAARMLVTARDAVDVVEDAFRAVSRGNVSSYPLVRERLAPGSDVYGIKSGGNLGEDLLGLKIGGYWNGNRERGLTNHQSTTVLTDPRTGCPSAFVSSNYLTGLRTAAACAIAIRELARPRAQVLALIGAGAQSRFHIEAARLVRDFQRILVASRNRGPAEVLAAEIEGIDAAAVEIEEAVRQADVIITLTPARSPLVRRSWVRPGTHISAMGADTLGKNELDVELMLAARVWADDWGQALTLGESQHAAKRGLIPQGSLGDLLEGRIGGRGSEEEVTVFDSTGLAIQDLAVAACAARKARETRDPGIVEVDLAR